jgi:putative transposase
VGEHPSPPRGEAARARRPRAQPHRRDHRHAERQDDRKGGPRGYDAAKRIKGRKRHVAVDTGGLLLGVIVHAADIQDADGAGDLLRRLKRLYPWLRVVFADSVYDRLAALLACFLLGLTLIIIRRLAGAEGFVVVPRRWAAERTLGWLGRWRRLAKEYEELPEVSETMVKLAMIRLMLHRLAHPNRKRLPAP